MKKLVKTLIFGVFLCFGRGTEAQEFLVPPAIGPPPMELPSAPAVGSGLRGELPSLTAPSPISEQPAQELIPKPISSGDLQFDSQPFDSGDKYRVFDCEPALLESTGTWLRRGFWYSEVDVLLMDLIWARDNTSLAFQLNANGTALEGPRTTLALEGGRQGAEAVPRLNLGRFLFRDHKNRDHAAEFVFYGGGQWTKEGRLDAINDGVLTVTSTNNFGITTFTGATSMQYDYNSRFNNFELNYHVKSRMRKDRMELEPSGQWVRRAQPSTTTSLIAGIRYFNLSEDFNWQAFGIDNDNNAATAPQSGNYRVDTDNDLYGAQLGFSWTYETARWSLGMKNKGGIYINRTDVLSSFEVTGDVTSGNNNIRVDNLSFITESSLIGKWHLRPNFSLRAGLEILYVSSIAHASEQLDFIPVSTSQVVAAGDSTFMGGLIGFEGYW